MRSKNFHDFRAKQAFTLIELLVVVAIIAILISILLPSLQGVRKQARATVCASNQHHVGQAVQIYLAENTGIFPASYLYALDSNGGWDPQNQPNAREYGYVHWSWYLYDRGKVQDSAFECPEIPKGGAPRTNPGEIRQNWEAGQIDDTGASGSSVREDKQAPRMALTANAAIMPRNKFNAGLASDDDSGPRLNKYVRDNEIISSRPVILATELHPNWITAGVGSGGSVLSKSHRPINPFYHVGSGTNEYGAPLSSRGFIYGPPEDRVTFGLRPYAQVKDTIGALAGSAGPETNAIGRHHPGGDRLGGTANFLYVDGHSERKTVLQTMLNREWGEKYYAINGENDVLPDF